MQIAELFQIVGLADESGGVCDFCGGPDLLVRYVVEDAEPEHVDQWLACGPCSTLIVHRDVDGLVASAMAQLENQLRGVVDRTIIEASVRELHRQFWQAWKGH